jgi:hypothetical protein
MARGRGFLGWVAEMDFGRQKQRVAAEAATPMFDFATE